MNTNYGHYYSLLKCDEKWIEVNDNKCYYGNYDDIKNAYILFYKKQWVYSHFYISLQDLN